MKVVLLAGGLGTRISEESHLKPKPMIEIGEMPILWHIMKYYSSYGFKEFIILAGYKQYLIKEYFANYFLHNADITFDMGKNTMEVHNSEAEDWKVTVVDTGLHTMTEPEIFDYLQDDKTILEQSPMQNLAAEGKLMGYYHDGFWQCMDTQREKKLLEELWASGKAPWKRW